MQTGEPRKNETKTERVRKKKDVKLLQTEENHREGKRQTKEQRQMEPAEETHSEGYKLTGN